MQELDRARLRELLPTLLQLLESVASGDRTAAEADREYRLLHTEVRSLLALENQECICPWPNVWGWEGTARKSDDWQALLASRATKPRIIAGLEEPPLWELTDYWRNGNRGDAPFWSEFAETLEPEKQAILIDSLDHELAIRGLEMVRDPSKLHQMPCNEKRGQRTKVWMYKVREGAGAGEVQLRIFFEPDTHRRLVLLHGYDKGADLDNARELREAAVACTRRQDYLAQRAAGLP